MQLIFDSIEEVTDFVTKLKKTRGGKTDEGDAGMTGNVGGLQAPPPMPPPNSGAPQQGFPQAGFAPQGGGAGQTVGGFPVQGVPVLAPEAQVLLQKLGAGIDGSIASGQPTEPALQWFRAELSKVGISAAAAATDLGAIKGVFLPQLAAVNFAALQNIAKLMGIV